MTAAELIKGVNDAVKHREAKVYVERHLIGRVRVYGAKALGFGTNTVLLRIDGRDWIPMEPTLATVISVR